MRSTIEIPSILMSQNLGIVVVSKRVATWDCGVIQRAITWGHCHSSLGVYSYWCD